MASIRNVKFGRSVLKWDTGEIRSLKYNPDNIEKMFIENIKPNIKINNRDTIKAEVFGLIEKLLPNFTMDQFCTLIVALRETEIDTTNVDNDGNFIVNRIKYNDNEFHIEHEKITYYNVAYHVNKHCTQLWRCCFVRAIYPSWYRGGEIKNLSYTTGEWKDDMSTTFLDQVDEFASSYKRNKNKKGD